jgi:diaminohydroxyphosphoribosylaminopyrimidine deaminase/5-amino-6-(5-phosphoribosylamino)uracil reductase
MNKLHRKSVWKKQFITNPPTQKLNNLLSYAHLLMRGKTMHEQFLQAALNQAWLGRGFCAPNPSVGAVAVQSGEIIAQSWHRGAGTPHAEVLLLADLPEHCPDITIYVTLEPCNHWGLTPPCVDAIIKHGIKKVVYAYADPNPLVSENNTPSLLRQQGISVVHYPMPEINEFYQSYQHWTLTHTPWVTAKIAQTFDGKIAGPLGAKTNLSNALCSEFTHEKRLHTDIILTTAATVNQDDPRLNARFNGHNTAKPVAIIDRQLTLNRQADVLAHAKHCHVYYDNAHSIKDPQTANVSYHSMPAGLGRLDLKAVIHHLGHLGYHDVWVEAGGELFNALHQAGLVNRTYVYLVPRILGLAATPAYQNIDMFNAPALVTWQALGDNMVARFDWQEGSCSPV